MIFTVVFSDTHLTTFLASSWPELACSLSAHPWLVSRTVSVPWSGSSWNTHSHTHTNTHTPSATHLNFYRDSKKNKIPMRARCSHRLKQSWVIKRNPSLPSTTPGAPLCLCRGCSPDGTVNIQPFIAECVHQLCRYTGKGKCVGIRALVSQNSSLLLLSLSCIWWC